MTMAFFREDPHSSFEYSSHVSAPDRPFTPREHPEVVPIIGEKLKKPAVGRVFPREWLLGLIDRSVKSAAATVVIGRAGTGKTVLAAQFVKSIKEVSWYTIDAMDADWGTFQSYFRAVAMKEAPNRKKSARRKLQTADCSSPLDLFADVTAGLELKRKGWPEVLVLDGIHHLFDCSWFGEFFELLITSMPIGSHVIMLSRSKPPTPIWRLRSKQMLNVVDEKLLALSQNEVEQLIAHYNAKVPDPGKAVGDAFGRIGSLLEVLRPNVRSAGR